LLRSAGAKGDLSYFYGFGWTSPDTVERVWRCQLHGIPARMGKLG
jgi:hypothetical protein